jgi:nitrogen fixation protein FixH
MSAIRAPREFTGRHMLFLIVGFFGVVISVNVGMAVVASTSWTGLVVANSYVASQEFEEKRIAHLEQQAAGWAATFTYAPGVAELTIVDSAGTAVDLGSVTLLVNRPVGGHDDQKVPLDRLPDGRYAAALELAAGTWEVLITAAETPKGPFGLRDRFSVGSDGK